jgi:PAS domain-containing protein
MELTKFRSNLWIAFEQLVFRFQEAQNTLTEIGRSFINRHHTVTDASHAKENDLRELFANSTDAIVLTNADRRFMAANLPALKLFRISEVNMAKFTMDAFLSDFQASPLARSTSRFVKREEQSGKCEIRRLDGTSQVARYVLVPNFSARRHLYRFLSVSPRHGTFLTSKIRPNPVKKHWPIHRFAPEAHQAH